MKNFITFNEPQVFIGLAFVDGVHAPGHKLPRREALSMAHHVMMAHGLASMEIRSIVPDTKDRLCAYVQCAGSGQQRSERCGGGEKRLFPYAGEWGLVVERQLVE